MKIYAAADIHGSQHRMNIIFEHIKELKPDLVVICGDLTQYGPGVVAKEFLEQIPVDTLMVPGNIDSADVGSAIESTSAENIDHRHIVHDGVCFVGIGGMIPNVDLQDIEITSTNGNATLRELVDEKTVLVTHVPPYKTQDKVFLGGHIGSKELRNFVDLTHPRLVLCGHVHENPGMTTVGNTTVVNCSIGKRTEGALVEIKNNTVSVRFCE